MNDVLDVRAAKAAGRVDLVQASLGKELLLSERRRVTLLIALLASLLILSMAMRMAPELYAPEIRSGLEALLVPLGLILVAYLVYELVLRAWLGRLLAADKALPRRLQYLNVFVEMALPTLAILVGAFVMGPLPILAGAIPFIYFLFILLSTLYLDFWLCVFAGATACAQFLAATYFLIGQSSQGLNLSVPVLAMLSSPHQYLMKGALMLAAGLIAGFVAGQIRQQLVRVTAAVDERNRAVGIFGQHVSPQVAELLLTQPVDYAGQERNVCVMFLDIRDFSKLAGDRTAPEVVAYLNALFGPMIPIINSHSGIVNKFLGDGFMAVFGAPVDDKEQCSHAIRASLEILRQVEGLNQLGSIPPTRLGIGLHVGQAVTGNVGSSERKEYTIIGDVVNLASRIEQANKPLGSSLLVSEAVAKIVGTGGEFPAEDMGEVELKGQRHPVRLYKLS